MPVSFLPEFAMRYTAVTRRLSLITLAGSVCLLAACGMDPPPAAGQQPGGASAAPPEPAGMALVEREDLTLPPANAEGVRCNIESMGGQLLETTYPTLASGREVQVVGWYALPSPPVTGEGQVTASPAAPAGADAGNPAAGEPPAAALIRKPMLVIASEGGASLWTVALPALRERRDVAKAFDDPALGKSGFNVELDLSTLPDGRYAMHLSDDAHSKESVCGLGRGFVIK